MARPLKSTAPDGSRGRWPRRRGPSVSNGSVNQPARWPRDAWLPTGPKCAPSGWPSSRSSRRICVERAFIPLRGGLLAEILSICTVAQKKKENKKNKTQGILKPISGISSSPVHLQSLRQHPPVVAARAWRIQTLTQLLPECPRKSGDDRRERKHFRTFQRSQKSSGS